ncbi:hypothetical protein CHS0354_008512 [Potamilus streckersoni]|uniref:CARD domain-containing protein n=1 Tax=Potamilus streckersoni TaxID=2493646 RepID=A0AAE0S7V5_9BIVA|nr:hypothetical protein CHS0354_008512 [Potamilus streckersoni]
MNSEHKRALNQCSQLLLDSLDATPAYLYELKNQKCITEEAADKIQTQASRRSKVSLLLQHIQLGGPKAFPAFRLSLMKEYSWIVRELDKTVDEYQNMVQENISREQTNVTKNQQTIALQALGKILQKRLIPMVYGPNHSWNSGKYGGDAIIRKLIETIRELEKRCADILHENERKPEPLHERIEKERNNALQEQAADHAAEMHRLQNQVKKAHKEVESCKKKNETLTQQIKALKDEKKQLKLELKVALADKKLLVQKYQKKTNTHEE